VPDVRRLSDLLEELETRCTKLAEENEKLRSGLAVPRSDRIENNARETFNFAQKAIRAFVKTTYTRNRYTDLPIKEFRYDDFKRCFPNATRYQYPTEDGTYYRQASVSGVGQGEKAGLFSDVLNPGRRALKISLLSEEGVHRGTDTTLFLCTVGFTVAVCGKEESGWRCGSAGGISFFESNQWESERKDGP